MMPLAWRTFSCLAGFLLRGIFRMTAAIAWVQERALDLDHWLYRKAEPHPADLPDGLPF
jgi:hypothetical protein